MKLLKVNVLFLILISFAMPANAGDIKIGYVDMQEALTVSVAGKKAREVFKSEVDRLQKDLNKHQKELKKMNDELEKQAFLLSDETKQKKEKEYQEKIKEFQQFYQASRNKLKEQDAQLTNKIIDDLIDIIKKVSKAGGYTIVFQKGENNILFADESINLTAEVVKKYNNSVK
jgi:outer membrane protein